MIYQLAQVILLLYCTGAMMLARQRYKKGLEKVLTLIVELRHSQEEDRRMLQDCTRAVAAELDRTLASAAELERVAAVLQNARNGR